MEIEYSSLSVGEGIKEGSTWFGGQLKVAIKKLDANLVAADTPIVHRFLQKKLYEVKSLSHPNLVHVLDMVRNGDEAYLICEYVNDSTSLLALLRDDQADFPWPLRVKVAQQVSEAVAYLHKRGVHHQNLKPSNIFLVGKDYANVKVGDLVFWGSVAAQAFSSATFGKGPITRSLSTANLKVGATYTTWVAPEPLNRKAYMDDADVYAFGLVLYSLLTRGSPPARTEKDEFQFKDFEELKKKVPADAPIELWELAAKCIDANPKVRPTFERITDALKALYTDLTTEKKKEEEEGKGKEKEKEEAKPDKEKEEPKEEAKEPKKEKKKEKKKEEEPKKEAKKEEKKADEPKEKEKKEEPEEKKEEAKSNGKKDKGKKEEEKEEAKSNGKKDKKKEEEPKKEAKKDEKKTNVKEEAKKEEKKTQDNKKEAAKKEKNAAEEEKKPKKEDTKKGKKAKA